jgi:hypothetical protein
VEQLVSRTIDICGSIPWASLVEMPKAAASDENVTKDPYVPDA